MAFRTWGRLLLTALGVSVLAGAGQLGIAYGFGIVRLTGAFTGTTVNQWPAQLVWVGWFAANAAVVGAVLTGRLARRDAPAASTGRQLAVAGAAALGATVVAPLLHAARPGRRADLRRPGLGGRHLRRPRRGGRRGRGARRPAPARRWAGTSRPWPARSGCWRWSRSLPSLRLDRAAARPYASACWSRRGSTTAAAQRLALLLLPMVALLAGAATGGLARWRGPRRRWSAGPTGVAGPVLVAFAYLTAGPGDAVDRYQLAPYYGALIAVAAGALGVGRRRAAALAAAHPHRRSARRSSRPTSCARCPPARPLPGAADDRDSAANDRDGAERTDRRRPTPTWPPVRSLPASLRVRGRRATPMAYAPSRPTGTGRRPQRADSTARLPPRGSRPDSRRSDSARGLA